MKLTIQEFKKRRGEFEVKLRAGVEINPPNYPNIMFFLQMASNSRERGEQATEPIYLTLAEMVRLSVLMTAASQFWTKTLDKYSSEDDWRVRVFCDEWAKITESINKIFSDEV